MARKQFPLFVVLNGIDRVTAPLKRVNRGLDGFAKKADRVGKKLSTNLTAPVALAGGSIIRTAFNFEKSMNKVEALTQATGGELAKLRELAMRLGSETQFSASQAADAMGFLGMAGFNVNQILQSTPALLNLAAAAEIELAQAADIASNIMGAFGIQADQTARVTDILAATTAGANVDMSMLAESMSKAAPVARSFGVSLEETAATIGFLGNIGIQGSEAGVALRAALTRLAAPTAEVTGALNALGISVTDENMQMRNFTEILADVGERLETAPNSLQLMALKAIFGQRAISGMSEAALQAARGNLPKFIKALRESEGRAESMAQTMSKGVVGSVYGLGSAVEGLQITIADSGLLKTFTDLTNRLTAWVRTLSGAEKELLAMGVVVAGLLAVAGPLVFAVGMLATGLGMLATPVGLTIAGLAALAVGIVALVKNWETLVDTAKAWGANLVDNIKGGIASRWAMLVGWFRLKLQTLGAILPDFVSDRLGLSNIASGAPAGSRSLNQAISGSAIARHAADVRVSFDRMPQGARAETVRNTGVPLTLEAGYAMGGI